MTKSTSRERQRPPAPGSGGSWITVSIVIMIGLLARFGGISEWWLNPDEGIYYSMLTWQDPARFLAEMAGNAHPPLFYLVTRLISLWSRDFAIIRGLSALCGVVAILAIWLVAREIVSSKTSANLAGFVAAALLALTPGAIIMSQLIRPYMMQLAFVLLAFYWLLKTVSRPGWANALGYSVFVSLAVLTHYSSIFALGVFGALILSHWITRDLARDQLVRICVAHLPPIVICLGLYVFHLRPHLIGSSLATEALEGWLASQMVGSVQDVGIRFLAFAAYWFGLWLAIPAVTIWLVGLVLSVRTHSRSLLVMNLSAFGIAIAAASLGQYPFGACRHTAWLIGFFVVAVAVAVAQILELTPRRILAVTAGVIIVALAGNQFARVIDLRGDHLFVEGEKVLKRADLAKIQPLLDDPESADVVIMSLQSYYLLLPLYVVERSSSEHSPDSSFFFFTWRSRTVLVVNSWNLSVRPEDRGESRHLYTFVNNVDRHMPGLRLGEQDSVLMIFGGWSPETPDLLQRADERLPASDRLISRTESVAGLTALIMDIARYKTLMRQSLATRHRI